MKEQLQTNIPKLAVMNFLMGMHFFSSVLIPFFTMWGRLQFSQIMILESAFTASIFVWEIPSGMIADKIGRKFTLILAVFVNVIAILIYGSYAHFIVFLIGEIMWGLSVALQSGAFEAMVYDTLVDLQRENVSKQIFGRIGAIHLIGISLGSLLGSIIAQNFGLRMTMVFSVLPISLAVLVGFTIKEPLAHLNRAQKSFRHIFTEGIKNIRENRALRRLIFDAVTMSVLSYFVIWLYQLRLMAINVNIIYFGVVNIGFILTEVLMMNTFHLLEKLFRGKRRVIIFVAGVMGVGFLLMGSFDQTWVIILGIILAAGFGLARPTLMSNYMNKHIASDHRATVISTISMLRMMCLVVLNLLLGVIAEWNLRWLLIGIGILTLINTIASPLREQDLLT